MPHQVLVGVAQQVVAPGAVGAEVEPLEDRDQLREPVLHLLARAEPALVVEVGLVDDPLQVVRLGEATDDLVDPVADLLVALQRRHVGEAAAGRHFDERAGVRRVLVRDVLHEQQGQDVVLVLRGVHAAAQLVAALPERGVELGLLQGHPFQGHPFQGHPSLLTGRGASPNPDPARSRRHCMAAAGGGMNRAAPRRQGAGGAPRQPRHLRHVAPHQCLVALAQPAVAEPPQGPTDELVGAPATRAGEIHRFVAFHERSNLLQRRESLGLLRSRSSSGDLDSHPFRLTSRWNRPLRSGSCLVGQG